MQIAAAPQRLLATAPHAPSSWGAMSLGAVDYRATLTHLDLQEVVDDDHGFQEEDIELWTEHGTSGIRTAGALGAREGYATLAEATKALQGLTDDAASDPGVDQIVTYATSAPLASATAGAVLEHGGRFFTYRLDRDFTATEPFQSEPQVEDLALYDGVDYSVQLTPLPGVRPELRALVDGYSGLWLLGR